MTNEHQSQPRPDRSDQSQSYQPLSPDEQALAAGYVLGDLSDDEQRQMRVLLQQRPEMQREVNALSASLRSLPHGLPMLEPPPQLQSKILAAHTAMPEASEPAVLPKATPARPSIPSAPTPEPATSPSQPSPIPWSKIIAGIATLMAVLLGANNAQLRLQLADASTAERDRQDVTRLLQQPNSRLVALEGRDETNTATAGGTLLFTAGQWQEVVVSLNNLPPLPADQVYRMWLTLENGDTLFCGEFNTQSDGRISTRLEPPKIPPQGIKTTGLFVTKSPSSAPLDPTGSPIMVGEI